MRPGLAIGAPHVVRYTVPAHQTAPNLLPTLAEFRRLEPVFATGFMVGLMEAPCVAALDPHLEPGEVPVGTLINITHLAASPPGMSLVAEARATAVEGQSVRFAVVVDAAGDTAAAGEVGLRVVEVAQFRDRLAAKQAQTRRRHPLQHRGDHEEPQRQQSHVTISPEARDGSRSHTDASGVVIARQTTARGHLVKIPLPPGTYTISRTFGDASFNRVHH